MASEIPEAIICGRVGQDEATPCSGSRTEYCQRCKEPVWLAPTGQKFYDQHHCELICVGCFRKLDTKPEDIMPPTADQLKEIANYFTGP